MLSMEAVKGMELGERFIRRNPLCYPQARKALETLERRGCTGRHAWTVQRLQQVLATASRTTYGRTVGGGETLASWPLLEKHTVRDYPQTFVNGPTWLAAHASTSGTTGTPLKLLRSPGAIAFEQACIDRVFEKVGVDPANARIAVLRGDAVAEPERKDPPYWKRVLNGRKLIFSSNNLSPRTIHDYADALEAFSADVLYAYPTSLENLCRMLEYASRRLHIPRVVCSSEVLRPETWEMASDLLDCVMADYYGQAERLAFAHAFQPGEYCFLAGYSHLEFISDESTTWEEEGSRLYEIVGTSLWNTTMPLVRYRTGDYIRLPATWGAREIEQLAYGCRSFEGVLGRDQEVLLGPDGVRLTGMHFIAREVDHILRVQLIQTSLHEVQLLVLPGKGYSADDEAQLLRNARVRIPPTMRIRVDTTARLEQTVQGKTPLIIHGPAIKEALRRSSDAGHQSVH